MSLTYIKFTAFFLATSVHYLLMFKGQVGIVCYYNVYFNVGYV